MLIILSPAKTLNFEAENLVDEFTQPVFAKEAESLVKIMQKFSATDLQHLMSISPKLALLNYDRYQTWNSPGITTKPAILAFDGDVYDGLKANSFTRKMFTDSQKRLRILSGLYGVLKPLDLIKPHRLEMGTALSFKTFNNLYDFWKTKIVHKINKAVGETGNSYLLNLASNEYFKSIDSKKLKCILVNCEFRDFSNGSYKIISFYAKRARGMMARFVLENNINSPEDMKAFNSEGYHFSPSMSNESKLVFIRDH